MRARQIAVGVALLAIAGCAATAAATSRGQHPQHAALAADGRRSETLTVLRGADSVTISAERMPGTLARAWTPADSGVRPELVKVNGTVQVFLTDTGRSGPAAVWIQISSAVRWRLQLNGGARSPSPISHTASLAHPRHSIDFDHIRIR